MPKYETRQRRALLSFLSNHPDEQFSARQIASELEKDGISLSAVYRNLTDLEAESRICRCKSDSGREVYYRYVGAEECKHCLHLSCKKCGKTFHMHTPDAEQLIKSVKLSQNFEIDKTETVLYGICKACR